MQQQREYQAKEKAFQGFMEQAEKGSPCSRKKQLQAANTWVVGESAVPHPPDDVLRHLKGVAIPMFGSKKRDYEGWKAAFDACIGQHAISSEMKLLQLRQYVSGMALACISGLGYSAAAYEASQNRLERSFGGSRHYLAVHLEASRAGRLFQLSRKSSSIADLRLAQTRF